MLELSMFSKSSGEILGTLLTRSIKKRPTLLSAATLPDWNRLSSAITQFYRKKKELITLAFPFHCFPHLPARPRYMRAPSSACPVPWQRSHPPGKGQRSAPWCDLELHVSSVKGPLWKRQTEALRTRALRQRNKTHNYFTITNIIWMPCLRVRKHFANTTTVCLNVWHYLFGEQPAHL